MRVAEVLGSPTIAAEHLGDPVPEALGDQLSRQVGVRPQQRLPVGRLLAADARRIGPAVEGRLDGGLDQGPLLLDDDDLVEAGREVEQPGDIERRDQSEFQDANPALAQEIGCDAEEGQGLEGIAIGLAGGDDPDLPALVAGNLVQAIGAGIAQRQLGPCADERLLQLRQPGLQEAGMRGVHERLAVDRVVRQRDRGVAQGHGRAAVYDIGGEFQRHPQSAEARHRDAVQAQAQNVLRVGGGEHRHTQFGERPLRAARHRRALGGRVVADEREHPTERGGAAEVAVPQGVGGPVEARRLAVPIGGHPVDGAARPGARELRAEHGVGGQFLVDGGPEDDAGGRQLLAELQQFLVVAAEW